MTPWQIFGLTASALFVKMFMIALAQAFVRVKYRRFARPEDAAFFGRGVATAPEEHPVAARGQAALRNDLENIPIFLFLMLGVIHLDPTPQFLPWYALVFVSARTVHTLAYLRPTQPLRNWAYILGIIVCMVLVGHLVVDAFA